MRHPVSRAAILVALIITFTALAPVHAAASSPAHLLLTADGRYEDLYTALQTAGGRVLHAFPGLGLIAEIDPAAAVLQVQEGRANYVTADAVPAGIRDSLSPESQSLVAVWEAIGAPVDYDVVDIQPPENDVLLATDQPELGGQALDPSLYQQSEFMIGKVAVSLVLVDSSGAVDANAEDWSPERQQHVFTEVVRATSWWQARQPQAPLEFVYQDHFTRPLPFSYEPISRPHSEDRLWISEATQQLGFRHSSYLTATRLLNRAVRDARQADWAFTIYVVDSLNDADNRFEDGYFAYSYIHGPYMVVTYGNNGYGPENMAAVVAHEMGHIFGAMDEYAASGVTSANISGYLGVPTYNAEADGQTDVGCIMRGGLQPYRLGQLCPCSAAQVGWRDSDGDGLLDPVDTEVAVELSVTSDGDGVTLIGSATDIPYPSPTRTPITINHIARGHYRVNQGPWFALLCGDGACDGTGELFELTLPAAPVGEWLIEVRFTNDRGTAGSAQDTLTIQEGSPPVSAVTIEAEVETAEDGPVTVFGRVLVEDGTGPLATLEVRVDSAAWRPLPTPGDEDDSGRFSYTLEGLVPGSHTLEVRAGTADPWTLPATWSGTVDVAASQQHTDPDSSAALYLPMVVSTG